MIRFSSKKSALNSPKFSKTYIIDDHQITSFYGLNTSVKNIYEYPDGFSPDSLNWVTGDQNECLILRQGTHLLGKTKNSGSGKITGLGIGVDINGKEVPFFTYGKKLKYYDNVTDDTVEIGTDLITGNEISINPYQSLGGYHIYVGSPDMNFLKIPVSNPGSSVNQGNVNYRGAFRFGQSRTLLWNRRDNQGGIDKSSLFMSFIDSPVLTNPSQATVYTPTGTLTAGSVTVTSITTTGLAVGMEVRGTGISPSTTITAIGSGQITLSHPATSSGSVTLTISISPYPFTVFTSEAVGSSGSINYTHTLTNVSAPSTCFNLSVKATVTAGTETFRDNGDGTLTSNLGGTGTINYATGVLDITFSDTTTGSVTADYYIENATLGGIMDFASLQYIPSSGVPSQRLPGTGRVFPQFGGGDLKGIHGLINVFYSMHTKKTWQTTVPTNDDDSSSSPATNLFFREEMGISSPHGLFGAPEGIYFVNNQNPARPRVYWLKPYTSAASTNTAIPVPISDIIDLSMFAFDYAVVRKWGNLVLVSCQQLRGGVKDDFNSRTFVYNTIAKTWNLLDCPASVLADYNGTLISGDPLTNNVWTLFSGFDDDNAIINNYWTSGYTNNGTAGVKTMGRMVVNGLIQASQNIKVELSFDGGEFTEIFRINGDGNYVDTSKQISVGSYTMGSKEVGGGAVITASPFEVEFNVSSPRYEFVRVRFTACVSKTESSAEQGGGWAQINFYRYKLIKYKGKRSPNSRMA